MNLRRVCFVLFAAGAVGAIVVWAGLRWINRSVQLPVNAREAGRAARIQPSYTGCWFPPNIAAPNFVVREEGEEYRVRIHSESQPGFVIASHGPGIKIPLESWRQLLHQSRGVSSAPQRNLATT